MSKGNPFEESKLGLLQDRWGKRPGSLPMQPVLTAAPDDDQEVVTRVTPRAGGIKPHWSIMGNLPSGTYADLFKHGGAADLPAWAYRAAVAQLTYKKHKEINELAGLPSVCPMCAALVDSIGKLSVMWLDKNIAFNAISRFDRSVKVCKVCEQSEGAISRHALDSREGHGLGHTWQTLTEFRQARIDIGIVFFQEGAARHAVGHFRERDRRRDKISRLAAQLAQHDQETFDRLFVRDTINYWL